MRAASHCRTSPPLPRLRNPLQPGHQPQHGTRPSRRHKHHKPAQHHRPTSPLVQHSLVSILPLASVFSSALPFLFCPNVRIQFPWPSRTGRHIGLSLHMLSWPTSPHCTRLYPNPTSPLHSSQASLSISKVLSSLIPFVHYPSQGDNGLGFCSALMLTYYQ